MTQQPPSHPIRDAIHDAEESLGNVAGMVSASSAGAHEAQAFVLFTAIADIYEIEAGQLALHKAVSPEVRSYAELLVDDHRNDLERLRAIADRIPNPVDARPRLDGRREGMVQHLEEEADGEAFERRYLQQQLAAHREELKMRQGYAEHGDQSDLKRFAAETVLLIERHLRDLQALGRA